MDVKQEIMKYVSSGGAPEALANFAPARAALEALTKSQAAASPAAVRTPTGYLAGSDKAEGDVKIGSRLLQVGRGAGYCRGVEGGEGRGRGSRGG